MHLGFAVMDILLCGKVYTKRTIATMKSENTFSSYLFIVNGKFQNSWKNYLGISLDLENAFRFILQPSTVENGEKNSEKLDEI